MYETNVEGSLESSLFIRSASSLVKQLEETYGEPVSSEITGRFSTLRWETERSDIVFIIMSAVEQEAFTVHSALIFASKELAGEAAARNKILDK